MPTPDPRAEALAQLNESAASPERPSGRSTARYPFGDSRPPRRPLPSRQRPHAPRPRGHERARRQLLHLVQRRLAPRAAGQDGARAPLRAPDVQRDRDAQGGRVRPQARGERRRVERRDLGRLDLLPRVPPRRPLPPRGEARERADGPARPARPQVTSEKEVVANERRYRVDDDVEGAASELLYKTAFTKHPYHWPTIGWMEDIQGFTPEDCERFYRTYYAPNNAVARRRRRRARDDVLREVRDAYGQAPPRR